MNSLICFTFLSLVLAHCTYMASGQLLQQGDHDWNISIQHGYPQVDFNSSSDKHEILIRYNTPLLTKGKNYSITIFEDDCTTQGDGTSITTSVNDTVSRELAVALNVNLATISSSPFFSLNPQDETKASFNLCVRLDFSADDVGSVNFHDARIFIHISTLSGFSNEIKQTGMTSLELQEKVYSSVPVDAYQCNDYNERIDTNGLKLSLGDHLQLCIRTDQTNTPNSSVVDLMSLDLERGTTYASPLSNFMTSANVVKECSGGICNVKVPLTTDWFGPSSMASLVVNGVAVLLPVENRRLTPSSTRHYQNAQYGVFRIRVNLDLENALHTTLSGSSTNMTVIIAIGAGALLAIAVVVYFVWYQQAHSSKAKNSVNEVAADRKSMKAMLDSVDLTISENDEEADVKEIELDSKEKDLENPFDAPSLQDFAAGSLRRSTEIRHAPPNLKLEGQRYLTRSASEDLSTLAEAPAAPGRSISRNTPKKQSPPRKPSAMIQAALDDIGSYSSDSDSSVV